MILKLDSKDNKIHLIPENELDIFKLGKISTKMKSSSLVTSDDNNVKFNKLTISSEDLINIILT